MSAESDVTMRPPHARLVPSSGASLRSSRWHSSVLLLALLVVVALVLTMLSASSGLESTSRVRTLGKKKKRPRRDDAIKSYSHHAPSRDPGRVAPQPRRRVPPSSRSETETFLRNPDYRASLQHWAMTGASALAVLSAATEEELKATVAQQRSLTHGRFRSLVLQLPDESLRGAMANLPSSVFLLKQNPWSPSDASDVDAAAAPLSDFTSAIDAGGDWSRATRCTEAAATQFKKTGLYGSPDHGTNGGRRPPMMAIADESLMCRWRDTWPQLRQWLACVPLSASAAQAASSPGTSDYDDAPPVTRCTIPIVDAAELPLADFDRHVRGRSPVIFRGAVRRRRAAPRPGPAGKEQYEEEDNGSPRFWETANVSTLHFTHDTFLERYGPAQFLAVHMLADSASGNAAVHDSTVLTYETFLDRRGFFRPFGSGSDNDLMAAVEVGGRTIRHLKRHHRPLSVVALSTEASGRDVQINAGHVDLRHSAFIPLDAIAKVDSGGKHQRKTTTTASDAAGRRLLHDVFSFMDIRVERYLRGSLSEALVSGRRNLIVAAPGATSAMHQHAATWHSVLHGVKYWLLVNPVHRLSARLSEDIPGFLAQWNAPYWQRRIELLLQSGFRPTTTDEEGGQQKGRVDDDDDAFWESDFDLSSTAPFVSRRASLATAADAPPAPYQYPSLHASSLPLLLHHRCPRLRTDASRRRFQEAWKASDGNDVVGAVPRHRGLLAVIDELASFLLALRPLDGLEFIEHVLPRLRQLQSWIVGALQCRRHLLPPSDSRHGIHQEGPAAAVPLRMGDDAVDVASASDSRRADPADSSAGRDTEAAWSLAGDVARVAAATAMECMGQAGDMLYLPSQWWHLVTGVTEAVVLVDFRD